MERKLKVDDCPCCLGKFKKLKQRSDYYCIDCDTLYTPVIDDDVYNKEYYEKYIAYHHSPLNDLIQEARWGVVRKHRSSGKLLDIGCSVGSFLERATDNYQVQGTDINKHCVNHCNIMGIQSQIELPANNRFDIITMFDVLEHVPYLDIVLETIWIMLKPGGTLVVGTPNFRKDRLEDIDSWRHYRPTEHVWCFSENSMKAIAERMELRLIDINFNESEHRPPKDNIATYVFQ